MHHSNQQMDFSTLALHISASAQDIKIMNTIYVPYLSLIITTKRFEIG